ncbi:MAG: hypothetical protein AMXMBFR34_43520 [Myxococcaceae bacterium]
MQTDFMTHALQVYLDEKDYRALREWAAERGWTLSQAARAALRALTRPGESDPLLAASGMIEGLPADLSERVDEYLRRTFVAARPTHGKTRAQRARKAVRR